MNVRLGEREEREGVDPWQVAAGGGGSLCVAVPV